MPTLLRVDARKRWQPETVTNFEQWSNGSKCVSAKCKPTRLYQVRFVETMPPSGRVEVSLASLHMFVWSSLHGLKSIEMLFNKAGCESTKDVSLFWDERGLVTARFCRQALQCSIQVAASPCLHLFHLMCVRYLRTTSNFSL